MFKKHNDKRTYAAALTCIDCNCGLDNIEIAKRLALNTQCMFFCFSFLSLADFFNEWMSEWEKHSSFKSFKWIIHSAELFFIGINSYFG